MTRCRCGWDGTGDHLCHRCGKNPGKRCFITRVAGLAGAQLKFGAHETWGCESCVEEFIKLLKGTGT